MLTDENIEFYIKEQKYENGKAKYLGGLALNAASRASLKSGKAYRATRKVARGANNRLMASSNRRLGRAKNRLEDIENRRQTREFNILAGTEEDSNVPAFIKSLGRVALKSSLRVSERVSQFVNRKHAKNATKEEITLGRVSKNSGRRLEHQRIIRETHEARARKRLRTTMSQRRKGRDPIYNATFVREPDREGLRNFRDANLLIREQRYNRYQGTPIRETNNAHIEDTSIFLNAMKAEGYPGAVIIDFSSKGTPGYGKNETNFGRDTTDVRRSRRPLSHKYKVLDRPLIFGYPVGFSRDPNIEREGDPKYDSIPVGKPNPFDLVSELDMRDPRYLQKPINQLDEMDVYLCSDGTLRMHQTDPDEGKEWQPLEISNETGVSQVYFGHFESNPTDPAASIYRRTDLTEQLVDITASEHVAYQPTYVPV